MVSSKLSNLDEEDGENLAEERGTYGCRRYVFPYRLFYPEEVFR